MRAQKVEPVVTPKVVETPVEEVEDFKETLFRGQKIIVLLFFP